MEVKRYEWEKNHFPKKVWLKKRKRRRIQSASRQINRGGRKKRA